jgi:hypothetical protein
MIRPRLWFHVPLTAEEKSMNDPRQPVPVGPSLHPQPGAPRAPQAAPLLGSGSGSLRPQHVVQPPGAAQPRAPQQSVPQQHAQPHHPQHPHARPMAAAAPVAADDADLVELSEEDDSLSLVEEEAPAASGDGLVAAPKEPKKIIKWDAGSLYKNEKWKRTPTSTGLGPIRVKTFHGKLSEQGLEYIDHAINEWADNHPEYEIKNVTTNIGMFDGKFRDLALIVNIWY